MQRPSPITSGRYLQSSSAPPSGWREYRVGKWTEPEPGKGPLFVFAQQAQAQEFRRRIARGAVVYPCQWEPWQQRLPRPLGPVVAGWSYDTRSEDAATWRRVYDHLACVHVIELPRGTRLARRVRLLEPRLTA